MSVCDGYSSYHRSLRNGLSAIRRLFPPHSPLRSQRATQGPHRQGAKSQISPTTQTPSSCLSDEAVTFAFGLGGRGRPPAAAASTSAGAKLAAGAAVNNGAGGDPAGQRQSQGSLGLSGGFVARAESGIGSAGDRLTVLSLEIHVQVGSDRRPDPRRDPVHAVCWRVKDAFTSAERELVEIKTGAIVLPLARTERSTKAGPNAGPGGGSDGTSGDRTLRCLKCGKDKADAADGTAGAFCTFDGGGFLRQGFGLGSNGGVGGGGEGVRAVGGGEGKGTFRHGLGKGVEVVEVCSEAQLFRALAGVFRQHDPDFVVGWEIQGDSLGYVIERGLNMVRGGAWRVMRGRVDS